LQHVLGRRLTIDDADVQNRKASVWNSGLLRSFEDKILFKEKFCDTVFQTTDFSDVSPRYVFRLGKNELTYKDYHTIFIRDILDKQLIVSYFETSRYLIVQVGSFEPPIYLWIYDKPLDCIMVHETSNLEDWILENDIETGPGISVAMSFALGLIEEEYLYSYIEPFSLIESLGSEETLSSEGSRIFDLAQQKNENDNPILVKIKIKTSSED